MKKVFAFLLLALISSPLFAGDVWVNGYTRKDGTYVQGHYRSEPNAYKWDNKSYTPSEPAYNPSYYQPTKQYNSDWYQPSETRFQDSNQNNNYQPTGYEQPYLYPDNR